MFTLPITAMILSACLSGWLAVRTMRMWPSLLLALALGIAAMLLIGSVPEGDRAIERSENREMYAIFLLIPAAVSALIGATVGSFVALWLKK